MQADGASSPTDQAPLPRRRHYDVSGADGYPGRDGACARSLIHAQAKTALEAEMQAASDLLEAPSEGAERFVRRW